MLFKVSERNGKICKTLVRSQLEQRAISGYRVQERLCDTEIMQGKVSRMTSPMGQRGNGFATRAKLKALFEGGKGETQYCKSPKKRLRWKLKGGLEKKI